MHGILYAANDPSGARRYVGSSVLSLNQRVANHRAACASDPLSCPFYREAAQRHGGLDGYTFEILAEIPNLPQDRNAARQQLCTLEMTMIEMSRAAGHDLWNHNRPLAPVERAAAQRAWRIARGQGQTDPETGMSVSYMAQASRAWRQRRRERLAAEQQAAAAEAAPVTA